MKTRWKKWAQVILGAGAVFTFTANSADAQLPGGIPKINGGANSQIQNSINQGINNQLQQSIQVKPPQINNALKPNLNLNNSIKNSLDNSLNGSLNSVIDNAINNKLNLSVGSLGTNLTQSLNLNTNGDLGATLNGLNVNSVVNGSLAQRIGLNAGDKIVAINRAWVNSPSDMAAKLKASVAETGSAWIYVERNGENEWVRFDPEALSKPRIGVALDANNSVVTIARVDTESPAARAGVKIGDELVSINGRAVKSSDDVIAGVKAAAADGEEVRMTVKRAGETLTLASKVEVPGKIDARNRLFVDAQSEANTISKQFAEIAKETDAISDSDKKTTLEAIAEVESQISATASATAEQYNEQKAELVTKVDELESSIEAMANDKTGETKAGLDGLKDKVANLNARLQSEGETQLSAFTEMSSEVVAAAKSRTSAKLDTAQEVAARLKAKGSGQATESYNQFESRLQAVTEAKNEIFSDASTTTQAQVEQFRESVLSAQSELEQYVEEAQIDADAEASAMVEVLAEARAAADLMVQSQFDSASEWKAHIESNVDESVEAQNGAVQKLVNAGGEKYESMRALISDSADKASNLKEMSQDELNEWKSDLADQREALKEQLKDSTTYERQLLTDARDAVNTLRSDVAEYQRAKRMETGETVQDMRSDLFSSFQEARTELQERATSVPAESKDQFEAFRNEFQTKFEDFKGNVSKDQVMQAKNDLQAMQETYSEWFAEANGSAEAWMSQTAETMSKLEGQVDAMAEAMIYATVQGESQTSNSTTAN